MAEFNYINYWFNTFKGGNTGIIEDHLKIIRNVCIKIKDLRQNNDANIPISEDVRKLVLSLPFFMLPQYARKIHDFGHFKPQRAKFQEEDAVILQHGAYWKFSNVVDQILREKFNISHDPAKSVVKRTRVWRISLGIYEGVVRVQIDGRNLWVWDEICYAEEENIKVLRHLLEKLDQLPAAQDYDGYLELTKTMFNSDVLMRRIDSVETYEAIEYKKKDEY